METITIVLPKKKIRHALALPALMRRPTRITDRRKKKRAKDKGRRSQDNNGFND